MKSAANHQIIATRPAVHRLHDKSRLLERVFNLNIESVRKTPVSTIR